MLIRPLAWLRDAKVRDALFPDDEASELALKNNLLEIGLSDVSSAPLISEFASLLENPDKERCRPHLPPANRRKILRPNREKKGESGDQN